MIREDAWRNNMSDKDCRKCQYHHTRTIFKYELLPCYNCKWNKIKEVHSKFKDNFKQVED